MKMILILSLLFVSISGHAVGQETSAPASIVQNAAHQYISNNADFGGHVNSPCPWKLADDSLTVTCEGTYEIMGPGGGGRFLERFVCAGQFVQGANGAFTQQSLECRP